MVPDGVLNFVSGIRSLSIGSGGDPQDGFRQGTVIRSVLLGLPFLHDDTSLLS